MTLEFAVNRIDKEYWFDLGISYQRTEYHHNYGQVITIALGLASIYIRWGRNR
jgi:hypothetical protein